MNGLGWMQALAFALVAVTGTAVVLTREPLRQALVNGLYGLVVSLLFLLLAAPDVAISELAVGTVAVPLMFLLALARVREFARRRERGEGGEER